MKKKYKVIVALLLLITLFIQLFPVSGRLKAADERAAENVLGPGKYFYLDPTWADGDWREAGAKIFLYCRISQELDVWRTLEMQPDGDLLKVKLPDDMEPMSTGQFKLVRCNPAINVEGGDSIWGSNMWGQCPGIGANLRWSECPAGSNTFKLTAYSAGSWVSGTWNGRDYGGETLYFINMDKANPLSGVQAKFSVNGASEAISSMTLENESLSSYSVKIPENGEYDAVTFMDDSGAELGSMELLNGDYEPDTKNTYYYKRTSKENNETVNGIDAYPAGTESIAGKKLYLDAMDFSVNDEEEIYIQIGEGTEAAVTRDSTDTDVYSYTIPAGTSANQQTILTIRYKENRYRFMWNDINKNMVCLSGGVAGVFDTFTRTADGKRVIYFDATLSKLSYTGDASESFAIPESGKKVWYRAWKSNDSTVRFGEMTLLQPRERNGNTYGDVWRAEIDSDLEYLSFFSGTSQNDWRVCPKATVTLNIPAENVYSNPCFYADAGDDSVYKYGTARDGYWGEVYTIRDAESNKNNVVVDIPSNDTFTHQLLAYYVSATLYDYYTDYELNGNNRDSYSTYSELDLRNSHRIYQPFRQFNMALSDYYRNVGTESQLYWGNFQHPNYGGSEFSSIANTLNLFGYNSDMGSDMFKKFFYQNNSMWDRNGPELPDANNATVGLVSSSLVDGNLMMKTDKNTTAIAPFFNAEFLQGKNSKNAVLGKVYEDVKFPFIQQTKSGLKDVNGNPAEGTVDYWYFNSADNTASNKRLRLKQDKNDGTYYLETGDAVKGTTSDVNGITANDNYFPFNDNGQSGNSGKLNYGFGQKMEFNFKLTPDGTVETTEDVKVPIEFTFSGDDDVWIFIDGQLVLDVGGGHGVVEGVIDFAKLRSNVSGIKNVTGGGRSLNVTQEFPSILKNDRNFYKKEHTLTMFYMERGLWESNLYITFNFPDESIFSVEKEVNTETVNNIFKDIFNQAAFPFNIKNQATHYGTLPVGGTTGFGVSQADISEYGSVGSGKLENAAGAVYTLNNTDESLAVNGEGMFTLKNGERVDFVNQFRRGSYIYLKEEISQDNFSTRWELYDNDSKVTSTKVPASHVNTIGGKELTEDDMVGNVISDGRQESYIGNAGIANSGYTRTGPAKIGDEKRDTNDTIVFRSFSEPDGIVGLNLRVKEINTVRTGSVTIAKEQAAGSSDLGETEFEFKITFTNISDMHFETAPIEQTIKLKKGASYTISGIPAGTEYKIEEMTSEGYTLKEVKPTVGNDTNVLVTDGIVTGKVVADDTELAPTSFVFVNAKDVGSIDILKKDADGAIRGVEFTLYEADKSTIAKDSNGNILQAVTDSTGKISLRNIPVGTQENPKTYYLKETKTVKGYVLMKEPIEVKLPYEYHVGDIVNGEQVAQDGITNHLTFTIINDKVFLLPSSGQSGVGLYVMLGVVLTVTAGGGLFIRARQKGKQQ